MAPDKMQYEQGVNFKAGIQSLPALFKKSNFMKACRVCKTEKILSEFYRHPDYKDGHMGICKDCQIKQALERKRDKPAKQIPWFIFD